MYIQTLTIPVATDGAGAATAYSDVTMGLVELVKVTLGTLASGAVDFTITDETTGAPIITITNATDGVTFRPRGATHDATGAALLYAAAGTPVADKVAVNGRIKVVVAQGGATASGSVVIQLS